MKKPYIQPACEVLAVDFSNTPICRSYHIDGDKKYTIEGTPDEDLDTRKKGIGKGLWED